MKNECQNEELLDAIIHVKKLKRKQWSVTCKQNKALRSKSIQDANDAIKELDELNHIVKLYDGYYSSDVIIEAERRVRNSKAKANRVGNRIQAILMQPCLFLTFTFTDRTLERTSEKTRRRYVKQFLSNLKCEYVANIDFGKKNGREHYHAIVGVGFIDYTSWKFGSLNGVRIKECSSSIALSRYLVKLTLHTLKDTAGNIIYSRHKN